MKIQVIKEGNTLYPYSEDDEERLQRFSNAVYVIDIKNLDIRTTKQNSALHLWCKMIADTLNSKGMYMTSVFSGHKIEWTMELVKETIFKPAMKAVAPGISSTTKLMRKELDAVIDVVTSAFASRGIEVPKFPSRELWEKEK